MGAHNYPVHHDAICRLLRDAEQALAYNAKLHRRILRQTAGLYNLELPAINWRCVMLGWSASDLPVHQRWPSLVGACKLAGVRVSDEHCAESNAHMTLELWRNMGAPSDLLHPPDESPPTDGKHMWRTGRPRNC